MLIDKFLIIYLLITLQLQIIFLIIYKLCNFDNMLGVVSHTRVSGKNRTHDIHVNSLAHYPLDYQGAWQISNCILCFVTQFSNAFLY